MILETLVIVGVVVISLRLLAKIMVEDQKAESAPKKSKKYKRRKRVILDEWN